MTAHGLTDQQGLTVVKNLHADVQFGSNTGGIGNLPGIPFAEITQVLFNGVAAPLTYVSPLQINAVVPTNIFSGSSPIAIQIGSATSQPGTTISVQ